MLYYLPYLLLQWVFALVYHALPYATTLASSIYIHRATKTAVFLRDTTREPRDRKRAAKNYSDYKAGAYICGGISLLFALGPVLNLLIQQIGFALYNSLQD